jgi:hypothetical protein
MIPKLNPELAAKFASATLMLLAGMGIEFGGDPEAIVDTVTDLIGWAFMGVGVLGYIRTYYKKKRQDNGNL